jgi:hypothetical protein
MYEYYKELGNARRVCNDKERMFAISLAAGMSKIQAHAEAYGYPDNRTRKQIERRCYDLLAGPAGKYYGLLIAPFHDEIRQNYTLKRLDRMALLSEGAVKCMMQFDVSKDTADLGRMAKLLNELNKMDGQHAAQELNVKGVILGATLNTEISDTQASDLYRRMMQGAELKDIEHTTDIEAGTQLLPVNTPVSCETPEKTQSEANQVADGGATLDEGVE